MNILDLLTTKYDLAPRTYIPSATMKTHIVLHGSLTRTRYTFTGQENTETVLMKKWNIMADKYAGHYVVGRSGSIYNCIDDDYWTNHLALGKKFSDYNKDSLAVFLCNELYLTKQNNQFYAFGIDKPHNIYKGPTFEYGFRDYNLWADYDELQIASLGRLLGNLCDKHGIPKTLFKYTTMTTPAAWREAGIVSCANMNPDSFSLPLPDWALNKICETGKIELVS